MKLHTGFLGLTLASVVALASANAADMYVPGPAGGYKDGPAPVESWNGAYVGINGGYAWGGNDSLSTTVNGNCQVAVCPVTTTHSFASDGGFGGGQIGYNWQPAGGGYKDGPAYGNFVFGIEADIDGAGISGSKTVGTATADTNLDWFGTVRGRVGYAVGAALLYGTGGLAFGGVQDKLTVGATTVPHDTTATGYAAGGGLEYAFNPAWSGKVEYQYIDLGTDTVVNGSDKATFNHDYNTVRVGLNYHILPGYEPLK
ncbi:MAG: outer membrane protein [Rhodomicrobium sp.]